MDNYFEKFNKTRPGYTWGKCYRCGENPTTVQVQIQVRDFARGLYRTSLTYRGARTRVYCVTCARTLLGELAEVMNHSLVSTEQEKL